MFYERTVCIIAGVFDVCVCVCSVTSTMSTRNVTLTAVVGVSLYLNPIPALVEPQTRQSEAKDAVCITFIVSHILTHTS